MLTFDHSEKRTALSSSEDILKAGRSHDLRSFINDMIRGFIVGTWRDKSALRTSFKHKELTLELDSSFAEFFKAFSFHYFPRLTLLG